MKVDIIVSAIVALTVGCIPALLAYLINRRKAGPEGRKTNADAAATITDAAGDMVTRLDKEIKELKKRITVLERENRELHEITNRLEGSIAVKGKIEHLLEK